MTAFVVRHCIKDFLQYPIKQRSRSLNSRRLLNTVVSPFLKSLTKEVRDAIPQAMLDFHVSGGFCRGSLVVKRGRGLANVVATLGMLPTETPKGETATAVSVQSSKCEMSASVRWKRFFAPANRLESRWLWNSQRQLAVDSFTYLGISDFAAFGFRLVPISWSQYAKEEVASGMKLDENFEEAQGNDFLGFRHVTEQVWVLGVPLPSDLALTADGVSMPHRDGRGWFVNVDVTHRLLGQIVSYRGNVRVVDDEESTEGV